MGAAGGPPKGPEAEPCATKAAGATEVHKNDVNASDSAVCGNDSGGSGGGGSGSGGGGGSGDGVASAAPPALRFLCIAVREARNLSAKDYETASSDP
jgi:hypothetical protein